MQRVTRAAMAAGIFWAGIWLSTAETSAQSMPKEAASRVEMHTIPTLTISDQQFLNGDARGKPVTVAGEFRGRRRFVPERRIEPIGTLAITSVHALLATLGACSPLAPNPSPSRPYGHARLVAPA